MAKQALEGSRLNAFAMDPNELTIIGLDTDDGSEHPLYDERVKLALGQEFVNSVRSLGILQPVKVRKNGDAVEVVMGRQRVRAAREVNASGGDMRVPVMLERGDDDRLRDSEIAENEHRVADDFPTKLKKLTRYLASGRTEHEAGVAFGVDTNTIKRWLKLMEASPQVRKAVADGRLTATAAVKIAELPRDKQHDAIEQAAGKTVKAAEKVARQAKGETVRDVPSKKQMRRALVLAEERNDSAACRGFIEALRWVLGDGPLPSPFAEKGHD